MATLRSLLHRAATGALLGLAALALPAAAGELTHDQLARRIQPPLHVGDKLHDIPAWPISSELEPDAGPVAYAFESIDLAPIPGFEGTPINLLVTIDRRGNFLGVELIRQHEPVFLSGLGEVDNTVTGLNLGASDFILKPYDLREISARIAMQLRRFVRRLDETLGKRRTLIGRLRLPADHDNAALKA